MNKINFKKLWFIYLIFLIGGIFYVRYVLDQKPVNVIEVGNKKEPKEEVRPVEVKLVVEGTPDRFFTADVTNMDSVYDFLVEVRQKKGFYFEHLVYTDKVEILVNNVRPAAPYTWRIFHNDADITDKLFDTKLVDKSVYVLKLVQI